MGGSDAGSDAIKAMVFAGILSAFLNALMLFKEPMTNYFIGILAFVDFYELALVVATFFVSPVGEVLATLLTQKYSEISSLMSQGTVAIVNTHCLMLRQLYADHALSDYVRFVSFESTPPLIAG